MACPTRHVVRMAEALYSDLPYHSWNHAQIVTEEALRIADTVSRYNIPVNREAVICAAALHDPAYALAPKIFNVQEGNICRAAKSKEEIATVLARYVLSSCKLEDTFIDLVCQAIMSTNPFGALDTIEGKILAAADIASVAGEYNEFVDGTTKLREESAKITGKTAARLQEFFRGSVNYLGLFLQRRIELTPNYYNARGQSRFHRGALENIIRYHQSLFSERDFRPKVVAELGPGQAPIITNPNYTLGDRELYIGIDTNPANLQPAYTLTQAWYTAHEWKVPITLFVPGERAAISLPDASVDTLYLNNIALRHLRAQRYPAQSIREVLRTNGEVHVIETHEPGGSHLERETEQDCLDWVKSWLTRSGLVYEKVQIATSGGDIGWKMTFSNPA